MLTNEMTDKKPIHTAHSMHIQSGSMRIQSGSMRNRCVHTNSGSIQTRFKPVCSNPLHEVVSRPIHTLNWNECAFKLVRVNVHSNWFNSLLCVHTIANSQVQSSFCHMTIAPALHDHCSLNNARENGNSF